MAHFAQLDDNNIVLQVIVVNNSECEINGIEVESVGVDFCKSLFGQETNWKQTSYNKNIRKNYAGIGYAYREDIDAFVAPQPFSSWTLNETTGQWEPPISRPQGNYDWNENQQQWIEVTNGT